MPWGAQLTDLLTRLAIVRSTLPARAGFRQTAGNWWDRGSVRGHPGSKRHRPPFAHLKKRAKMRQHSQRLQRQHDARIRSRRGAPTTGWEE